jgi:hypothetical protein
MLELLERCELYFFIGEGEWREFRIAWLLLIGLRDILLVLLVIFVGFSDVDVFFEIVLAYENQI